METAPPASAVGPVHFTPVTVVAVGVAGVFAVELRPYFLSGTKYCTMNVRMLVTAPPTWASRERVGALAFRIARIMTVNDPARAPTPTFAVGAPHKPVVGVDPLLAPPEFSL